MVYFTPAQIKIIEEHPIANTINAFRDSLSGGGTYFKLMSLRLLTQIDAKLELVKFVVQLTFTVPASITLTGSYDDLGAKLLALAAELCRHATIPTTPRYSSLLEKIASKYPDLDVWTAVAELLEPDPTVGVDVDTTVVECLRKTGQINSQGILYTHYVELFETSNVKGRR
jgi:hypothetical protein